MKILVRIKKYLIFVIIHLSQNMMIQNNLVVGKMKDEKNGAAIGLFVGL